MAPYSVATEPTKGTSNVVSGLSSRLQSHGLKLTKPPLSSKLFSLKSASQSQLSASARRISRSSRFPVELDSSGSLMPLHSAVASARLVSSLSIESRSWGLVPQGISMPL